MKMRKCYIALLALLAFTACQQEPALPEGSHGGGNSFDPSKLRFNLIIEHPDGVTTKGVKKAWKTGDKVFLFISGISAGYLTATLTDTAWNTEYVSTDVASLGASGTLHAVYLPYGNDATPSYDDVNNKWTFDKGTDTYYFYASNVPYTVSGSVLSATVQMVKPIDYVQFFIPCSSASGTIRLASNGLQPAGFASIADDGTITENGGTAGTQIKGYLDTLEGEEGYYVSGKPVSVTGNDYYFALEKADGTSYAHYFKHRTSAIANNKAYQLPAYDDWPTVGGSRSVNIAGTGWKTVNEGADNPWVMGELKNNSFVPGEREDLPTASDWSNLMDDNKATWKPMSIWGTNGSLVVSASSSSNYIFIPWSDSATNYYWITGFTNAFQIDPNGTPTNNAAAPGSGEAYVRALEKLNWFRIIAKGDGKITRQGNNAFEYSIDGADWQTYSSPISVTAGQEIAFRSTVTTWNTNGGSNYRRIRTDFAFDVAGDITSLLVGAEFGTAQAPASYSFADFFKESLVEDASKLVLPMTSVPSNALKSFFDSCPNLVAGPAELPATSVAATCYRNMFKDCPRLTSAPIIRRPTTHRDNGWYQQMFLNCSSLQEIVFLDDYDYRSGNFTDWVKGVNAGGTFYKGRTMTTFPDAGNSSTPTGWNVTDYVEP